MQDPASSSSSGPHPPHPNSSARPPPSATTQPATPAPGLTPFRGPDGYYRISPADHKPVALPPPTTAVPTLMQSGQSLKTVAPSSTPSNAMARGGRGNADVGEGGATSASTVMGGKAAGIGGSRETGGEPAKVPRNGVQSIKLRLGGVGAVKASTAEMGEKREAMK